MGKRDLRFTRSRRTYGGVAKSTGASRIAAARSKQLSAARAGAGFTRNVGYYGRFNNPMRPANELKFHDIDVDDAVVATGGTIQNAGSINLIGQNITESTRIGRKCTIKSIGWRFTVSLPEVDAASAPPNPDTVRVLLYQDSQANGVTAAVTDILESAHYQSFNNLANKSRFSTLMDKTVALNFTTGLGIGADSDYTSVRKEFSFFKKCVIPLEFSGVADPAAMTEVRSNNLGVLLISQAGVAKFDSKFRLRFSDG